MPRWPKKTQQTVEEVTVVHDPLKVRVLEVRYERVFPVPNTRFGSERIGLVAAVQEGQAVNYVIEQLKRLTIRNSKTGNEDYAKAKAILADKNSFSFRDVSWAEAFMATFPEDTK
jgi:hypothetical protein